MGVAQHGLALHLLAMAQRFVELRSRRPARKAAAAPSSIARHIDSRAGRRRRSGYAAPAADRGMGNWKSAQPALRQL